MASGFRTRTVALRDDWFTSDNGPMVGQWEESGAMHRFIRERVVEKYGHEVADGIPILYGGSVKPDNAAELLALVERRPLPVMAGFFLLYVAVTALSLPGAVVMTLAAGAIFGLVGAFVAYNYLRRSHVMAQARLRSALSMLLINLVIGFSIPVIDWKAHLGGLVAGLVASGLDEPVGGLPGRVRARQVTREPASRGRGAEGHAVATVEMARAAVRGGVAQLHPQSPQQGVHVIVLLEAAGVVLDHRVGGIHDVLRRAVVLFQLDDLKVRIVALEVENVSDVGAPERVDTLCVVSNHTNILTDRCELPDDEILTKIGILKLVHQNPRKLG